MDPRSALFLEAQQLQAGTKHRMNKFVHPKDYRFASPSHNHPLATALTDVKNASHALLNARAQAHLHTRTHIQIHREFAILVLPSGCVVATGTNMAAPVTVQS